MIFKVLTDAFLKRLPIRKKKQDEEEAEQKKVATETAYQGMVSLFIYRYS